MPYHTPIVPIEHWRPVDPAYAVAAGAALLDRARPGWHHQINTGPLDLNSAVLCILGQLWGYYTTGITHLQNYSIARGDYQRVRMWTHGFSGSPTALKHEWIKAITARREADAAKLMRALTDADATNAPAQKELAHV